MYAPRLEHTAFAVAVQALALSRAQLTVLLRKGTITTDEFRTELDATILRVRDAFARHDDRIALELTEAALSDLLSEA